MKKIACAFLALLISATAPQAAGTDWQDLGGGKARLLAQLDPANGEVSGVVEVVLEEGWKTYWREPGGSGLPPQFDFSPSSGFAAGEVEFPVPLSLEAGGARFAGYKERVLFPFAGHALGGQGRIALDLLIGVCEEICIPATASFEIPLEKLNTTDAQAAMAVTQARARLPGPPAPGMRIVSARLADAQTLEVVAETPQGEAAPAVFAEGPQGWYFGQSSLVSLQDGRAVLTVPVAGKPDGWTDVKLRLTLAAGEAGAEQQVDLQK